MTPDDFFRLMEATWPPAKVWHEGALTLRDGDGGGKRVSAASVADDWQAKDLARLEAVDGPLALIRDKDEKLDQALEARGWRIVDPVVAYCAPVSQIAAELPPLSAFTHWPPLQIAASIWDEGGIGPARLRVMDRVGLPKAAILARHGDRPAGSAFVAASGKSAMLHALEVRPHLRRQGVGMILLQAAANWASDQGAADLALVVTKRNAAARALYDRLGMTVVGQYHYRTK